MRKGHCVWGKAVVCGEGPWRVEKAVACGEGRGVWRRAVVLGEGPWCVEKGRGVWRRAVVCGERLCQAGCICMHFTFQAHCHSQTSRKSIDSMFVLINRLYPCVHMTMFRRKDKRAKTGTLQTQQCSVRIL